MSQLHLTLTDYQSDRQWRWLLQDERGNYIADYDVNLPTTAAEYQGFQDPGAYCAYHNYRTETDSLDLLGRWMGQHVFGGLRPHLAASLVPPATPIHLFVPPPAQSLLHRPLELAQLEDGRTFVAAGIRFIYRLAQSGPAGGLPDKQPITPALRLLTLFSLPDGQNPLNLRRERYGLTRLARELTQVNNQAIDLRILQYGATRATLRQALEEGDGWDIIHLSGHGSAGALHLEDEQGRNDTIRAAELADLLRIARPRLKLLILDACYSGGASHAAARRALGLDAATRDPQTAAAPTATELPSLAQALSAALDCAAVAMRYPVGDAFATDLMLALYAKLLDKNRPLPEALQLALLETTGPQATSQPPLSAITPLLVGPRAATLRLTPPARPFGFIMPQTGLSIAFPEEPPRFVGRVRPLMRASQALAPRSPQRGVLFYGMPGAGKTACALELAYRHEQNRFQGQVWYKAPEEGHDIGQALFNLLFEIERQLNGPQLALTAALDDAATWRDYTLPRLRALLGQYSLLLVLDNLESLLADSGAWRDPRWGELLAALLGHTGASRVVLTSRRLPATLAAHPALQREAIHALSFAESVLLAQELPHLRQLFSDEIGRELLTRALRLAQGHPKLLELADGLAANWSTLAAHLDAAEAEPTADSTALNAFLAPRPDDPREGETQQGEGAFWRALQQWTAGVSARLDPTANLLFTFLCRLEPPDRTSDIITANWSDFLQRLGEETINREPQAALAALEQAGLIAIKSKIPNPKSEIPDAQQLLALLTAQFGDQIATLDPTQLQSLLANLQSPISNLQSPVSQITIHPGVAELRRGAADAATLAAVDEELGNYWIAASQHGLRTEMQGGGGLVAESGRRAAPYLLRRQRWEDASPLLEWMIQRDSSPATLAFAIPLLQRLVTETAGSELGLGVAGVLANALLAAGRTAEAEQTLRDGITTSVAQGNYRLASVYAGVLLNLLMGDGRFPQALTLADEMAAYTRRAGLGPWTQLADETMRLQVLVAMGQYAAVLARVAELRPQLDALPEQSAAAETANPWNVRETLLDTGHSAALYSEQWAQALAFNGDILRYQAARGADALELARTRFNDYSPLLRLKRYAEARALLHDCRAVFEREKGLPELGAVYSALAGLEDEVGERATAVQFAQTALRYSYQAGDPEGCAISHHNLSHSLERQAAPPALVLAHRLAAVVINLVTQSGLLQSHLRTLSNSDLPAAPPSFAEVAALVEQIPGVQFRALFARLPQTFPSGDAAIAAVWQLAQQEKAKRQQLESTIASAMPPELLAALQSGDEAQLMEMFESLSPEQQRALMAQLAGVAAEAGISLPEEPSGPDMDELLQQWEPLLQSIAAIAQGRPGEIGRDEIEALLPQLEEKGWMVQEAVQRIWAGERDAASLTANLDSQDSALIRRLLAILS